MDVSFGDLTGFKAPGADGRTMSRVVVIARRVSRRAGQSDLLQGGGVVVCALALICAGPLFTI
jgi:hypothetical protein